MSIGWIKLHRKLLENDMFLALKPCQRDVMIICLLLANHQNKKWEWKGEIFECQPGQFITSLESLQKLCGHGTTIRNIRTAIAKLEKFEFLTNESTKTGRLITINNWDTYQNCSQAIDKGFDKELTKQGQRSDIQTATNKNEKKVKNEKKAYAEFVSMTCQEYEKLVQQYGEQDTKEMILKLDNYKGAHGKTYASDYHAILKWVAKVVLSRRPARNEVVF